MKWSQLKSGTEVCSVTFVGTKNGRLPVVGFRQSVMHCLLFATKNVTLHSKNDTDQRNLYFAQQSFYIHFS